MPLDDSILGGSVPFDPRETTANMLGRLTDEPAGLGVDLAADRLMRKVLAPKPQPMRPPVSKVSDPDGERAKPDLSSLGVPLEEATGGPDLSALGKPLEAPEAPKSPDLSALGKPVEPPKHNAFMRGFVSGMVKENPEALSDALEGISHLAPKDFKGAFATGAKDIKALTDSNLAKEYAKTGKSMWDIAGIDDALTWAGETFGSGLASTVPSMALGLGGAVVGGRVMGKPGAVVGGLGGAAVPSAMLNYGSVYKALKDEKVDPEKAAEYAAAAAVPITMLDVGSLGPIITRLGGAQEVKAQLSRAIAKRIAQEAAKGAGREGITEGIQDVIQSATVSLASDKPFWTVETAKSAIENAVGGAMVGGAMGGVSGIKSDQTQPAGPAAATPAQPPAALLPPPAGAAPPSPSPSQPSQPSPQQPAVATPAQPAQADQDAPSREDEDYAILRSVGYTDDDIGSMGQSFRDSEIKYYRDDIGIDPAELVQRYPRPQAATTPPATPQPAADAGLPVPAGSRAEPIKAATAADVARAQPAEPVSQAQAEAENYRHAHLDLEALGLTGRSNVSVETGAGGVRKGVDRDGKPWQVQMPEGVAYGRIKGTQGADGQPLDIFIGPQPHSQHVFVIDQHHPEGGGFDEHKIMAGFVSPRAALDAYKASYADGGGDRIGHVVAMSADEFKAWLQGDTTKPLKADGPSAAPLEGDILPPAKVATITEPAEEHHAQIEAVLGQDYDRVLPADTARAAEILSENPDMPPQLAFQHAVIANAVAQDYLTEQEAIDAYGQEVQDVLEPASQGTPERGGDAEPQGAASDEKPAGAATETGVVPDSSETGTRDRDGEAAEGGERDQPDTGRGTTDQPDAGSEADAEAGEPETVRTRITDAGEKIGGARKDQWIGRGLNEDDLAGMTGAELDRFVTKHNVWNRPDYAQAIADGVDPVAAALIKRIYDGISAHPNNGKYGTFSDPEKLRRNYIGTLKAVRNAAAEVKTVDQVRLINDKVDKAIAAAGLDRWDAVSTLKIGTSRQNPLLVSDRDVHLAKRMVEAGFPNMEPWARLFTIARRAEWQNGKVVGEKFAVHRKNGGRIGDLHDTREAAEAAAKAAYEALSDERKKGGEEPKRPHLDQVERTGPDYRSSGNVTGEDFIKDFGFRGVEFGNWVAGDERQKVVNLGYDALHDLARALGLPPKAMSLDGTLAVAFGARGRGGRAAAHYEADRTVINMTKLSGAGSLAHEWAHALDHYLGESHARTPYKGSVQSISGWRTTPNNVLTHYASSRFEAVNGNLPLRLREAANRLMQSLFSKPEDDAEARRRVEKELEDKRKGQQGWMRHVEMIQQRMQKGGSRAGLKEAQTQVEVWGRGIVRLEKQLADGIPQKRVATDFLKQATILSGESGDYWRRPNEMFARSLEAYVFDKLAAEGFVSQYLVQGVEPDRYGAGFKGNPYPAGDERVAINKLYDRLFRAITVGEGKLGAGTKIKAAEGLPEPVEEVVKVTKPAAQPTGQQEAEAVDQASRPKTLAALFADRLGQGERFLTILQARRLAKDAGFAEDAKAVEEAMELAVVMTARGNIETSKTPRTAYNSLVDLYQRQPRLATRTSTSARDQAYSTPVPLGYLAQHLAGVTDQTTVYEPTAGNGALLTATNPETVGANEINQERAKNLMAQGYTVTTMDATNRPVGAYDRILANPPFGAVQENGQSKLFDLSDIQPGYQTHEIDHVIALRTLQAMKDDGRAVLILGGISKAVTTQPARSDAYNGKAKRQFYKTLYDRYNVTDHFTVAGDLYERQGAGWPVDVIVINGRGKSSRALPAADVPRIYDSWTSLGGLLDAGQAGNARPAVGAAGDAAATGAGLEGGGGRDRGNAGGDQPGLGDAGGVRGQRPAAAVDTGAAGAEGQGGAGAVREPARSGEQPAAERPSSGLSDDFGSIFKDALDAAYGPKDAAGETGRSDERGQPIIETGAVLRTKSGRETAPAPRIDASTKRKTTKALFNLDSWLLDEARKEVAGSDYQTTLLKGLDPKNFSPSDRDTVNLLLFGDVEGPRPSDIVRIEGAKKQQGAKPRDTRPTAEVAKSAAENLTDSADKAFEALYHLFGGNKLSAGFTFDEDTYAKAKPLFEQAAQKFKDFLGDSRELVRRMVAHMRDALGWPRHVMEEMQPYFERFIADLQAPPASPRLEGLANEVRRAAEQALSADDGYRYGLRVTDKPLAVGSVAPSSKQFYADFISEDHDVFGREAFPDHGEDLPGTSAISLKSDKDIGIALMMAGLDPTLPPQGRGVYQGRYVSLLRAPDAMAGRDAGEVILPNAEVVSAWDKERPKARQKIAATETENQVVYHPKSKVAGLDTLVPVNMRRSTAQALDGLEDRVGPVDQFVGKELGYNSNELPTYFSAEQIDALGLAIDNIKRGRGFIIGDQTGIGKGRVNAAIIRWAIKNGRIPIFVTEKPGLYADMYRDLNDIGIKDMLDAGPRILATNADLKLPLEDGGDAAIATEKASKHNALLQKMAVGPEDFFKSYDMVFTNYSQMQTWGGEDTQRRAFLERIAPHSVLIFDESHNAGGQKGARKSKSAAVDRAGFARNMVQSARGVFYSSATYAKRPDVMDLYAATDMAMAVDDLGDLAEAIHRGGVPMQQVVASMLSEAGQYLRRERSFAGITYNTPLVPVDRDSYDRISGGLAAIQDLSKHTARAAVEITKKLKTEGQALGYDGATGDAGASSTSFTAVMHNVINQMLLAMKAEPAAVAAIAAIKRGEKPVLTVANTMESFLSDYSDSLGIGNGDEMSADFSDVLKKYLDRTRTIIIKKPFAMKGEKSTYRHYLSDAELGPEGVAVYNRAAAIIAGMDLSGLPVSPIDHIKNRLAQAGYSVGEITGRTLVVDYSGEVPVLRSRPTKETSTKGRNATRAKFNRRSANGGLDAVIINQAGSTGISMHASVTFDDQSKRHMIVVQAEGNIDTHMQLLGRVNRTGQVVLPEYSQLVADIPAEKRPAANLAKKMASLNANTTASRSSALTAKDVPDFLNQYGDEVAVSYLSENFELNSRLAFPVEISESGKFTKEDAMRKLTGRIPLLPLAEQDRTYDELESEYTSLLQQLEAAGENALEAKTFDLKARILTRSVVQGERNKSGSPFAAPVVMEKVSIVRPGKPYKPDDLRAMIGNALGESFDAMTPAALLEAFSNPRSAPALKSAQVEAEERARVTKAFNDYSKALIDDIDAEDKPEKIGREITKHNELRNRWTAVHQLVTIGRRVTLKTASGNLLGIVIKVERRGKATNPMALSTWKATFAVPDATRTMVLPFSRISEDGAADAESLLDVEVVPLPLWQERYADTIDRFQIKQTETREERYIATGNLLAAYDWLEGKGQILNYTDTDGHIRQGILTSRDFDLRKHAIARGKMLSDPAEVKQYLDENPGTNKVIGNDIEVMRENRWSPNYLISAPKAKRKGGVYYLDRELTNATGDFYSQRGEMQVTITPAKLMPALARIIALGARLKVPAVAPNEQKVEDGGDALASIYTPQARQKLPEVDDLIRAAARHLVGDHVEVRLSDDLLPISGVDKWGNLASTALGARGLYSPRGHWIALARLPGMLKTLFHEAYHAIEYQLQTPAERALMRRETAAIRAYVGRKRPHYSRAQLAAIDDVEIRAIGSEEYLDEMIANAQRPGEGLHIGVRRFFDRLWRMSRRLANGLRGLGFKTWEDIYEKAYRGEYATAPGTTPRPEASRRDDTLAALSHGPGGPNSFDNTLGDLVGARLARFLPNAFADRNMTEARVKVQDKFIRIKKAEQSVGQPVPSVMSAYQAESLYYGRTGWRLEQLEKGAIDPLVTDMTARDIGVAEINEFLYARHAVERNIRIGMMHKPGSQFHDAVFDTSVVGASGMSTDEANAIIAAVDQSGKRADYDAIEARVRDLIDRTRDALLNDGLITQETYDAWKQQYAYYVPLRGFADGSEYEAAIMAGRGYDTRGKEAKTAFGRKSEADGPLNYVLLQAEMAIVRGERNRVGNTMLRFVQNNPDPDRWEVNKPRFTHTIDRNTGLITTIPDNFADYRDPNVFITKVAGKPYRIRFHGPDGANLARALNNMGTSNVNYVLRLFAVLTRTMARLATQWNPEFTIPNFARDVGEAFINLNEQQQRGFIAAYAKHILPAVKGAAVATAGRGNPNDAYIRAFHEMDRAGGRIRFFGLDNPDDFNHTIARKMKRLEGGTAATMADLGEKLIKGIDILNGGVENGVRLAVYMAARDVGMSQADSAAVARDITVNFNRHGEMGGNIGALYMFYNAAAQGMARTLRAVQSKYVRRAFYAVAALGAMTAFYGIAAGGDDDDGEPHFLKIPAWDRDKNFIIMWPKGMGRDGKYVKIPVSFGLAGVFHAIGERMVAVAYGGEKPTKAAMAILSSVINVFDPTGGDENLVAKLVPTIGRPQVHIEMNKSWTGRPLYPDNSWDRSMPDSQKAFSTTSAFSKAAAAKINQWGGGSAYAPGAIDLHPASIDHWIQAITGGVGRFAAGLGSTAMGVYRGEEWDATKTPIVRRFYGSTDTPQADRAAYADARIEAKTREQQVDRAKKDLRSGINVDESRAFVEKHQGPSGEHIFKGADQRVKMLRRQEEQIKADTALPEDERAAQIKEIRGQMRDAHNEARKRYRKLKEEREKGRQGQ